MKHTALFLLVILMMHTGPDRAIADSDINECHQSCKSYLDDCLSEAQAFTEAGEKQAALSECQADNQYCREECSRGDAEGEQYMPEENTGDAQDSEEPGDDPVSDEDGPADER